MTSLETSDPVEFPAVYMRDDIAGSCTVVLEVVRVQRENWAVIFPTEVGDGPRLWVDVATMRRLVAAWTSIDRDTTA